jgi:hypothetical protein
MIESESSLVSESPVLPLGIEAASTMALKPEANGMEYDQDKVDEMTLALLWLTSFKGSRWCTSMERAGLGHDGATSLKPLHVRLKSKAKSIVLSE